MNEAIIQSVNYSDFLAITLPLNRGLFDRVVVYTVPGDPAIEVCKKEGVEWVETDSFYVNRSKFNRGAAYNQAFRNLKYNDWVTILDSDIVLPPDFGTAGLSREFFYGARRFNIETMADWERVKADPGTLNEYTLYRGFGYGYLQLFNVNSFIFKSLGDRPYYEHPDGSEADWRFRNNWGDMTWDPPFDLNGHHEKDVKDTGTHYLKCLPFNVIHLGITGVNSTGRHTPQFNV